MKHSWKGGDVCLACGIKREGARRPGPCVGAPPRAQIIDLFEALKQSLAKGSRRSAALLAVPFNETGYERPAPDDFAVADTVVVLAIVLILFCVAYCVRKLLKLRAELKALESEDDR
jgi:hypothetical protein